jgi:hypothetical protein
MAFPPGDYVRVTVRGNITGGETWSFSHYQEITGLVDLPAPADLQTMCDDIEGDAAVLWALLKAKCSAETSFTGVNTTFIRNGVTVATNQTNEATPIIGTASGHLPVFIARVVTLQTNRSGRSYRGRMYLPWTGVTFAAGQVLWGSESAIVAGVATFLNNVAGKVNGDLLGTTAGPVIYSVTAGAHEPVVAVRMDNKPDTQRGRERSIAATIFDSHTVP